MSQIYVLDTTGVPQGILEDYSSIEWVRDYYQPGTFKLEMNLNVNAASQIVKGRLIAPQEQGVDGFSPDAVYIIEQIEREIDERGKGGEVLNVLGRSLSGMFQERLVLPPSGLEFDNRNGPAESIMKYFVNKNCAAAATPQRLVPNLFVVTDLGRGINVSIQGRYQTVAEVLEQMALTANIGWETFYNTSTKVFNFDVIIGADHTATTGSSPVYFDVELETVRQMRRLESDTEKKSFAYVGGKGEGVARPIVTRYLTGSEPTGLDRREIWIDAQDLDQTSAQQQKGDAELQARQTENVIEVEVSYAGPFRYRRDWDLGDLVTARNSKWNLLVDVRIIGVTNRITKDLNRMQTTVSLSRPWPTLPRKIKQLDQKSDAGRRR